MESHRAQLGSYYYLMYIINKTPRRIPWKPVESQKSAAFTVDIYIKYESWPYCFGISPHFKKV